MTDGVTDEERWLPVVSYEGLYEVSDHGRVRSVDRFVNHARSGTLRLRGRILRPAVGGRHPRACVVLSRDGIERTKAVHALVARAFLGPCPAGQEVLHGPAGALVNRLDNLSYGTHSANIHDKQRDGTDHMRNRTHCPLDHLLEPPNLIRSEARDGHRACLACNRGRGFVISAGKRGLSLDLKTEADRYYTQIMGGTARQPGTCIRGHRIAHPNRVARKQACLACQRARASVDRATKAGRALDLQAESDRHYDLIMTGRDRRYRSRSTSTPVPQVGLATSPVPTEPSTASSP